LRSQCVRVTLETWPRSEPCCGNNNIVHIAEHKVTVAEVHEVVFAEATLFEEDDSHRRGRLNVWGVTATGRPLVVYLDKPTATGAAYVVTARPMTDRERRNYEESGDNQ